VPRRKCSELEEKVAEYEAKLAEYEARIRQLEERVKNLESPHAQLKEVVKIAIEEELESIKNAVLDAFDEILAAVEEEEEELEE